ncbi:MAG: histidine phosphatase family protein [Myxococcales bacterium]|nr:histidine phosphatase family protein [Myxococcales bacterium]
MSERAPIELTLVRHGESTFNVTGQWQGQGDAPLSPLGEQQALRVGARLARETFDRVVSSDLQRAHRTALATGHPVETREEWREIDVGRWEGLTRAEVAQRYPDEVDGAMRGDDVKIGGAESWSDLSARVERAMLTLLREVEPGARVCVVAHGGVIASLVSGVLGLREHRPRPIGRISNTAISRLAVQLDPTGQALAHARLLAFNDASHAFGVPAWASEMYEAGQRLVTLLADGPTLPMPWAGTDGNVLPVARVSGRSDAARGLADALRVPFEALDDAALSRVFEAPVVAAPETDGEGPSEGPAAAHPASREGRHVVVLPPADIARVVTARMRHAPEGPASVAAPTVGSVTNVVITRKGHTFADYASVRGEA